MFLFPTCERSTSSINQGVAGRWRPVAALAWALALSGGILFTAAGAPNKTCPTCVSWSMEVTSRVKGTRLDPFARKAEKVSLSHARREPPGDFPRMVQCLGAASTSARDRPGTPPRAQGSPFTLMPRGRLEPMLGESLREAFLCATASWQLLTGSS